MLEWLLQNPNARVVEGAMPVPEIQGDGTLQMVPQPVRILQVQDPDSKIKISFSWTVPNANSIGAALSGREGIIVPEGGLAIPT